MKTSLFVTLFLSFFNSFTFNLKSENKNYESENNYQYFQKVNSNKISFSFTISDNSNYIWYIGVDEKLYNENLSNKKISKINVDNISKIIYISDDGKSALVINYNNNLIYVSDNKILFQNNDLNPYQIQVAKNSIIWLTSNQNIYNININNDFQLTKISSINDVNNFKVDKNNTTILYTDNNNFLHKYYIQNNKLINYNYSNVMKFISSNDNNIIILYDFDFHIFFNINNKNTWDLQSNSLIINMKISEDNSMFIYNTNFYLYKININNNKISSLAIKNIQNFYMLNNNIWIIQKLDNTFGNKTLKIIDNNNNIHILDSNIDIIVSKININKTKFFFVNSNNYMYEYNFDITSLLNLNYNYVLYKNIFYFNKEQVLYANSKNIKNILINSNFLKLNTEFVISNKCNVILTLTDNLKQFFYLFSNINVLNSTITVQFNISKPITYNQITYKTNNVFNYLGKEISNSDQKEEPDICQLFSLDNKFHLTLLFNNLPINYNSSYYEIGKIDLNNNFVSNDNILYKINDNLTFTDQNIYKITIIDVFNNKYIEYIEIGNFINKFQLEWNSNDFKTKLQNYNISLSNEILIDNKNEDYQIIYNWLNLYNWKYQSNFQKIFDKQIKIFNIPDEIINNLHDKYSKYFWININKYCVSFEINKTNIINLLNNFNSSINYNKLTDDLSNYINEDILNYINTKILNNNNLANDLNVVLMNKIINIDDLNNYLLFLNNYNEYLKNNFSQIIKNDFSNLKYQNTTLFNSIINNEKYYLNNVSWTNKTDNNDFSKNINNNKIISIINNYKNKDNKHRLNKKIIISITTIGIILILCIIIVLISRNKLYIKNKFFNSKDKNKKKRNK